MKHLASYAFTTRCLTLQPRHKQLQKRRDQRHADMTQSEPKLELFDIPQLQPRYRSRSRRAVYISELSFPLLEHRHLVPCPESLVRPKPVRMPNRSSEYLLMRDVFFCPILQLCKIPKEARTARLSPRTPPPCSVPIVVVPQVP